MSPAICPPSSPRRLPGSGPPASMWRPPPVTCQRAPATHRPRPLPSRSRPCACAMGRQQPPGHREGSVTSRAGAHRPASASPAHAHPPEPHRQAPDPDRAQLHGLSIPPLKTPTRLAHLGVNCLSQHNPDNLQCLPRPSFIPTGQRLPLWKGE